MERATLGAAYEDNGLVFCTRLGRPLIKGNVYRGFLRLLDRAALPCVRFHDLRHACATLLLIAGVNPKGVSEMLGHASASITLDIYSHVIPDMQLDAAAIMAAVLQRTEPLT
jgi:integrase